MMRYWFRRTGRIILACLLTSLALGLFNRQFSSLSYRLGSEARDKLKSSWSSLTEHDNSRRSTTAQPKAVGQEHTLSDITVEDIYKKTLNIEVTDQDVKARYDLYLNKNNPLYRLLQDTLGQPKSAWSENTRDILFRVFGLVTVNNRALDFNLSDLEIEDVTSTSHVQLMSEPFKFADLDAQELSKVTVRVSKGDYKEKIAVSEVTVNTEGVRVLPDNMLPRSQSSKQTCFTELQRLEDNDLRFDIILPVREPPEETSKPIADAVSRFNMGSFSMVQPILLGLLYSIPFILFLRLKKHTEIVEDPIFARFFDVVLLFLILYSGQALLGSVSDLFWDIPRWLTGRRSLSDSFLGAPHRGIGGLIMLFPVLIWPSIVKHWERFVAQGTDKPLSKFLFDPQVKWVKRIALPAIFLWIVSWFAYMVVYNDHISQLLRQRYGSEVLVINNLRIALVPISIMALWAACLWLMYEIFGNSRAIHLSIAASFLMLLYINLEDISYDLKLRPILAAILILPFLRACARTISPTISNDLFIKLWLTWPRLLKMFMVIGAAVIAFLLIKPEPQYFQSIVSWSLISSAVWAGSRLLIFALLWVLLLLLRRLSIHNDQPVLFQPARDVGETLALTFFFLPAQEWLYLPIAFYLGFLMLRKWIFSSPSSPAASMRVGQQLRQAVRDSIILNDAERGLRMRRKELLTQLGKGEIEYTAYTEKVTSLEEAVEEKRRSIETNVESDSTSALNYGPDLSSWDRAKMGTGYGVLFALPWIVLFLNNFRSRTIPEANIEVLSLLTSAILTLLQWPLYGFFFGYFYPNLRGMNGMRKGFNFFIFIFVPISAATVITNSMTGGIWTTYIFWSLQLFIQCMLLGLVAGDYETLRRAGLSWRHLIDVHNLSTLAAWGSSLLVAIGAAITTLLTSGAAGLISSGLKVLLPDLQIPGTR